MAEENTTVEETKSEVTGTKEETKTTDKVLPQEEVNRLVAQAKSKGQEEGRKKVSDELEELRSQLEELKTKDMPEEEAKSYKQKKAEKAEQERIQKLEEREKMLNLRENSIKARDTLTKKNINQDYVRFLVESNEFESLDDKLEAFIDMYSEELNIRVEQGVKKALSGNTPKANVGQTQAMTQESFDKLGYLERLELKQKDPETYNKFTQ